MIYFILAAKVLFLITFFFFSLKKGSLIRYTHKVPSLSILEQREV